MKKAFIDPTENICDHVIIEENIFVVFYTFILADEVNESGAIQPINILQDSNIKVGVVIHSKGGVTVSIGPRISIFLRSIAQVLCGIGSDALIGFNNVVLCTTIGNACVIQYNYFVDEVDLPEIYHVSSMISIGPGFNFASIEKVSPEYINFSKSFVSVNHTLVAGLKRLVNEF